MIIAMNVEEIEGAARARMAEIKPLYEEYLALERMLARRDRSAGNGEVRRSYRGRVGLPHLLLAILSDGTSWSLDQLEQAVRTDGRLDSSRNTISTRLSEMVRAGRIARLEDGTYVRASQSTTNTSTGRSSSAAPGR
jgi:hypothetical protein